MPRYNARGEISRMNKPGRTLLLWMLLALLAATASAARAENAQTQPARLPRPVDQIERALLISIDGCRPDLLLRAKTPNVHKLIKNGSYTVWATTVPTAVTLPAHASM